MKITKYEHACWKIEEGDTRIIVDPGVFSASLADLSDISAVVVTHNHADHFDSEKLQKIIDTNPRVQIFATRQVSEDFTKNVVVPEIGKTYQIGDVSLEFFGNQHHLFNNVQNIAVSFNDRFFIPGDSYTKPSRPVEIAAAPASAPWLRIDEAIQNIKDIQAKTVLPTHNALLSEIGESIHYRILSTAANDSNKEWRVLGVTESIEI